MAEVYFAALGVLLYNLAGLPQFFTRVERFYRIPTDSPIPLPIWEVTEKDRGDWKRYLTLHNLALRLFLFFVGLLPLGKTTVLSLMMEGSLQIYATTLWNSILGVLPLWITRRVFLPPQGDYLIILLVLLLAMGTYAYRVDKLYLEIDNHFARKNSLISVKEES